MARLFNFKITALKPLSKLCISNGFKDFNSISYYVKNCPYGRNTNKQDLSLIITENKGTCSTKHAFLSALAIENNFNNLKLVLGIYKMNSANTPGIDDIILKHDLEYIPEAHNYLKFAGKRLDFTNSNSNATRFENDLLQEEYISPEQIIDYKIQNHKTYLKQWIKAHQVPYSIEEIWHIREQCIKNLSH